MRNKTAVTLVASAALLGCEIAPALGRPIFDDRFFLVTDSPHSHVEIPEITITVMNTITASGQAVEGSLDLRWENYTDLTGVPKFRALFLRYDDKFKGGAQQPHRIVGWETLESYLLEIGCTSADAKDWVGKVREKRGNSLSITNVRMPEKYLADYKN
jgi:hypothetical protein